MPNVGRLIKSENTAANPGTRTPVYDIALAAAKEGSYASLASLARAIGANYQTVYDYWNGPTAKPEFQAAFKVSRQRKVDEVKEKAFQRATDDKPSELMIMYILNNFDQEIVERNVKNRDATITIKLDVPTKPESIEGWAREVAALPPADYREVKSD